MNKVAIAFSTKDRVELSKRSFARLVGLDAVHSHTVKPLPYDIFWVDGSSSEEGQQLPLEMAPHFPNADVSPFHIRGNVRGGADAAIVYSLTTMLNHPAQYTHVGLVENDVLLHKDWFGPTMALFERGEADGLNVGAVSARAYEDRILIQRDGYAVMHNIGAGMVIFTREAANAVLDNFRTGWWTDNRRTFMQVSGLDIGRWGAFRTNEQYVTADWHFDTVLAELGMASLALTPCMVQMIGQVPPLHEQGLKLVDAPFELLRDDEAFKTYAHRLHARRCGSVVMPNCAPFQHLDGGPMVVLPHQTQMVGGEFEGEWRLKWSQGFGPFAYRAGDTPCTLHVPISGACSFMVSGGEKGGRVQVEDLNSGYQAAPVLPPEGENRQVANLPVPASVSYRVIRLTCEPGTVFYGIHTNEPQPFIQGRTFDHTVLPPT